MSITLTSTNEIEGLNESYQLINRFGASYNGSARMQPFTLRAKRTELPGRSPEILNQSSTTLSPVNGDTHPRHLGPILTLDAWSNTHLGPIFTLDGIERDPMGNPALEPLLRWLDAVYREVGAPAGCLAQMGAPTIIAHRVVSAAGEHRMHPWSNPRCIPVCSVALRASHGECGRLYDGVPHSRQELG